MILIFSTQQDTSTQHVINWLIFFNQEIVVINELNPVVDVFWEMKHDNPDLLLLKLSNGIEIDCSKVSAVWYRIGLYYLNFLFTPLSKINDFHDIYINLREEYRRVTEIIFFELQAKTIGNYQNSIPNKLIILKEANRVGLKTPCSRIITNAKNKINAPHVNKNISEVITFNYKEYLLFNRTTEQKTYPHQRFYPSLIQEKIEKVCELRIFFCVDIFFTMASFPENGKELEVDIRDITARRRQNRIPFELPAEISLKLRKLMDILNYNTCSIDMIIDNKNQYYFLEINPTGQFGSLSSYCNFQIEKYIAHKLIEYAEKNNSRT